MAAITNNINNNDEGEPLSSSVEPSTSSSTSATISPPIDANSSYQVIRLNHHNKMSTALESMLYEEMLCDVTIICNGQSVKAHRVILAASSTYFKEIFHHIPFGFCPIVFLKNFTNEDLNDILEFVYKGELVVPYQRLESLIDSAKSLGIAGLATLRLNQNSSSEIGNGKTNNTQDTPGQEEEPLAKNTNDLIDHKDATNTTISQNSNRNSPNSNLDKFYNGRKRGRKRKTTSTLMTSTKTSKSETVKFDEKHDLINKIHKSSENGNLENGLNNNKTSSINSDSSSSGLDSSAVSTTTNKSLSEGKKISDQQQQEASSSSLSSSSSSSSKSFVNNKSLNNHIKSDSDSSGLGGKTLRNRISLPAVPTINTNTYSNCQQDHSCSSPSSAPNSSTSNHQSESSNVKQEMSNKNTENSLSQPDKSIGDNLGPGTSNNSCKITKSKLRSWSQQIMQKNLAALKLSSSIKTVVKDEDVITNGDSSSNQPNSNSKTASINNRSILTKSMQPKPSLICDIPGHLIKLEPRRGRPRKIQHSNVPKLAPIIANNNKNDKKPCLTNGNSNGQLNGHVNGSGNEQQRQLPAVKRGRGRPPLVKRDPQIAAAAMANPKLFFTNMPKSSTSLVSTTASVAQTASAQSISSTSSFVDNIDNINNNNNEIDIEQTMTNGNENGTTLLESHVHSMEPSSPLCESQQSQSEPQDDQISEKAEVTLVALP